MKNLDKFLSLLGDEVDGLLLTSRYSRHYGAEFDIAEGVAIVTKAGCRYFTDSRYIESAQNGIKDFAVLEMTRQNNYVALLNAAIADFGVSRLGFEEEYLTVSEFNYYKEKLHADLVPYNAKINGFRGVKEAWELDLMRKAQDITDRAFAEVITRIRPGMTELELQAELIYCLYKNGGENLSFDPIVVSGPNGSLPHGVPSEKLIQSGEFVTMDFGCVYHGYCSDMTRTVAVGSVTDEMRDVYDTVLKAQLAGIEAAKAGATGKEVDGAARNVITDAGYGAYFGHSFGHGVGVEIHEAPNASPMNEKPLPEGAVISAEPGIYLPGRFGVRIEDVLILKEGGCEDITRSPKGLIIL